MKTYIVVLKRYLGLLLTLNLLVLPFQAQAQDETESEEEEEIISLTPFEVSEDAVRGYATTSSLSASRIAVPITDIAGSVITINEKLIEDTLAVNIGDTFNLVSGITTNENSELQERKSFSIRGYEAVGAQRDGIPDLGFTNNGGFDYSMIERAEIIKGPAGVQFGQHNSGGVVNMISKRPLPEDMTKIQATFGSYNSWRVAFDHSNAIEGEKGNWGYRVAGAFLNTDGIIALASETDKPASYFINPSISYDFNSGFKVWAWVRLIDDQSSRLATNAFIFGSPDNLGRAATSFAGRSSINVQSFQFVDSHVYEGGLSHSFDLGPATADFRLVARWGDYTHGGDRTRANGDVVFIDRQGNRIPDGKGNNKLGCETCGSVGRFPAASGYIESGEVVRFGRQGLRYTKSKFPNGSDQSVVAADLNLNFKLGPTRNRLLIYTQFRNADDKRGTWDIRINNSGTLPEAIRKEFGFETGLFVPPEKIVNLDIYDPDLPLDQQEPEFAVYLSNKPKIPKNRTPHSKDCLTIGEVFNCHQGVVEIWPNPYSGGEDLRPVLDQYYNIKADRGTVIQDRTLWNIAAIERMYLFDDRLILSGGIRFDRDDAVTDRIVDDVPKPEEETLDETRTGTYGLVAKIMKGDRGEASLFYNYAETFVPVFTVDNRQKLPPGGDPNHENEADYTNNPNYLNKFPNRVVTTDEFGIKINLLGSRVVGTFSYFETSETNFLVSKRDSFGYVTGLDDHSYTEPVGGDRTTEGFELDLAVNPLRGLNAIVSYGSMDSFIRDGLPGWAVPDSTFSWLVNYEFEEGPLKGFSITPSYISWGESQLNRASNFQLPPGDRYDIVFGYRWGKMAFRFRVENLENDIDSQPSSWWTGAGATKQTNYRFGWTYTF